MPSARKDSGAANTPDPAGVLAGHAHLPQLTSRERRETMGAPRGGSGRGQAVRMASSFVVERAAWAAARRAIGTRYGEQLT